MTVTNHAPSDLSRKEARKQGRKALAMEQSGADADAPAAKRQRAEEGAGAAPADERETNEPRTFVALNVNGLASRMLASDKASGEEQANSAAHAAAFVTHLFGVAGGPPDVICLTEIHFRAKSATERGELESLSTPGLKAADRKLAEKAHAATRTLLAAPELRGYTALWSLHAEKRGKAGICVLLRPGLRSVAPPRYSLDLARAPAQHNDEGRVIMLEFATSRVACLYAPNSGSTTESKARRAMFDGLLLRAVGTPHPKGLIICGDLNVSPETSLDVLPSSAAFPADMPGIQREEQERFRTILAAGALCDVWRRLHPGVRGGMTWRGGKYLPNKEMRLDHFVCSESLMSRVLACEAVAPQEPRGSAVTRGPRVAHENHYFGSDHWPLWLRLQ